MTNRADSLAVGHELAQALTSGWRPTPIGAPFHLPTGEQCYATHEVEVLQMLEGESIYMHKSIFGFNMLGMTLAAASAVGNGRRRRKAAREAEARFRPVDGGLLHVTNRRFAIQGQAQWSDLWYSEIRMSYCDNDALTLEMSSMPPTMLRAWPAFAIFGLFRHLAYGEVVQL